MKFVRSSRPLRVLVHLVLYAGVAALAACSSPPSRFYTLGAGGLARSPAASTNLLDPASFTTSATSATQHAASLAFLIEVPPVDVPSQVARNQLVVQTGEARVDVLEQERWASLPADEIRRALSGDLAARLGTFDVYGAPYPNGVPVYRISVNVRRFESWPDSRAVLDAVWSVRAVGRTAVLTCRTLAQVPVGPGYGALVEGHRQAVAQMADDIAAAVRSFGSGGGSPPAASGPCAQDNASSRKPGGAA
jgi:uncharacterized protein